jgi:SAM-dependent methyltransferase
VDVERDAGLEDGMRNAYAKHADGAQGWYRDFGSAYRNPHEDAVEAAVNQLVKGNLLKHNDRVLDLACGSGEVTRALLQLEWSPQEIVACDPYTWSAFEALVGHCPRRDSFADIASGSLRDLKDATGGTTPEPYFDHIVCAYALHLCERSRLPALCVELAEVADVLSVITPHKQPHIPPNCGWTLVAEYHDAGYRVRTRTYHSAKEGV